MFSFFTKRIYRSLSPPPMRARPRRYGDEFVAGAEAAGSGAALGSAAALVNERVRERLSVQVGCLCAVFLLCTY